MKVSNFLVIIIDSQWFCLFSLLKSNQVVRLTLDLTHTHRRVDDWVDPDTTIRNSFCWWENSNNWKHSRALWIKQKLNIKDRLMVVDFLIRRKWEHSGNGQIDQDCLCYFHTEVLCCLLIWYLSMRIWGLPLVLRFSISSRLENESNVKMCQIYPFVRNKHNFH